jgi:hypothetical protein
MQALETCVRGSLAALRPLNGSRPVSGFRRAFQRKSEIDELPCNSASSKSGSNRIPVNPLWRIAAGLPFIRGWNVCELNFDRGSQSREVLSHLQNLPEILRPGSRVTCLRGNYDQMFIDAVLQHDVSSWFSNGGEETLNSYARKPSNLRYESLLGAHAKWLDAGRRPVNK